MSASPASTSPETAWTAASALRVVPTGAYTVQWYNVTTREIVEAGRRVVETSAAISFNAPFHPPDPVVLHLKKAAG